MEEGLDKKIKEIGGLLGIDNIPDGIGDIIGSFLGEPENGKDCGCEEKKDSKTECVAVEDGLDPVMLLNIFSKVKQLQEKNQNDDKVRLLKALRPFLGKQRRQKVDQCVNLIMLKELAPLLGK